MPAELDNRLRIALHDASEHLAKVPKAFVALFKRGELSVELFAPHEVDTQQPHEQDEIQIVAAGTGVFGRDIERVPFGPGDFLLVAAGAPHALETFTDDFKTWVILFGPKGGYRGKHSRSSASPS
jgi:mannose-6-phosphate isomerase-like protein (cupin superfamily)